VERVGQRVTTEVTSSAGPALDAGQRREQAPARVRSLGGLLVLPALLLLAGVFLVPAALMLAYAFTEPPAGLHHLNDAITSPLTQTVLKRSVAISAEVTIISLAIGLPFAMIAAGASNRMKGVLLGAIGCTLFFSVIVRAYAWLALLGANGPVTNVLISLHLGDSTGYAHTRTGTIIALVQYGVPFMVLAIYDNVRRIDPQLMRAASISGASPLKAFLWVRFPLMLPGIAAGSIIVFITTLGYYIIPQVVGSPTDTMIGQLISQQITQATNWGLGAALASLLIIVALGCFAFFRLLTRLENRLS
jgi:ABC-type spermidine/putrescine transport system permease subunit I